MCAAVRSLAPQWWRAPRSGCSFKSWSKFGHHRHVVLPRDARAVRAAVPGGRRAHLGLTSGGAVYSAGACELGWTGARGFRRSSAGARRRVRSRRPRRRGVHTRWPSRRRARCVGLRHVHGRQVRRRDPGAGQGAAAPSETTAPARVSLPRNARAVEVPRARTTRSCGPTAATSSPSAPRSSGSSAAPRPDARPTRAAAGRRDARRRRRRLRGRRSRRRDRRELLQHVRRLPQRGRVVRGREPAPAVRRRGARATTCRGSRACASSTAKTSSARSAGTATRSRSRATGECSRWPRRRRPAATAARRRRRAAGRRHRGVLPGGRRAVAVAAGANHSLALAGDGTAWGWGSNEFGQLGGDGVPAGEPHADLSADAIPPRASSRRPPAPRGFRFVGVSAGYAHTVLTGADGPRVRDGPGRQRAARSRARGGPRSVASDLGLRGRDWRVEPAQAWRVTVAGCHLALRVRGIGRWRFAQI